jgi:hypothetical protein
MAVTVPEIETETEPGSPAVMPMDDFEAENSVVPLFGGGMA